jgi:hypothetical protein
MTGASARSTGAHETTALEKRKRDATVVSHIRVFLRCRRRVGFLTYRKLLLNPGIPVLQPGSESHDINTYRMHPLSCISLPDHNISRLKPWRTQIEYTMSSSLVLGGSIVCCCRIRIDSLAHISVGGLTAAITMQVKMGLYDYTVGML